MATQVFKRTAVAIAIAGALGLGAIAGDRIVPATTAAPATAAAQVTAGRARHRRQPRRRCPTSPTSSSSTARPWSR